jgi:hypothetical protein
MGAAARRNFACYRTKQTAGSGSYILIRFHRVPTINGALANLFLKAPERSLTVGLLSARG